VCAAAAAGARRLFVELLPGVTPQTTALVVGTIALVGVWLGAVAATFALRRLRT
jgi:hypothetical protein